MAIFQSWQKKGIEKLGRTTTQKTCSQIDPKTGKKVGKHGWIGDVEHFMLLAIEESGNYGVP